MNGEIWYRIVCECGAENFVYAGYFPDSDASRLDVEGYKCWSCKKENPFMSPQELLDAGLEDEEPYYFSEGKPVTTFWTTN